jgi:ABC-2 type transport system permease protein
MNLRRCCAVARKEFLHIFRDARSLGLAVAIPMMMLVLFGYALTLDVDNVPLAVWDQSETPASRDLIQRFAASRYFELRIRANSYRDVEKAVDEREALVALVIPPEFGRRVQAGRRAPVQVIVDGTNANTANLALGYAEAVVQTHSLALAVEQYRRAGLTTPAPPLEARSRVWYNADMESRNFIIPGLIAVIMSVLSALLTSLTVAREWEMGTMEQLISTPVQPHELVLGKFFPYFVIGMVDVGLAMLMGQFLFRVPLRGSPALVLAMASIFLVGALSLGLLVSILTKSQMLANQLSMTLTYLPAILLSGFAFAIRNMPLPIQAITYLFPARYFVYMLKGIYLKGLGLEFMLLEFFLLLGFGALVTAVAILKFRKKLE